VEPSASQLRRRSADLRCLAGRIERAPLGAIRAGAGPDSWRGPAANELCANVDRYCRRVADAADELRWRARLLDERAAELEAASAMQERGA
jgi:hypothetical protein